MSLPKILTTDVGISVALVIVLLGTAYTLGITIAETKEAIRANSKAIAEAVQEIRSTSVSRAEMESWTALLRAANGDLVVPMVPNY